MQFNKNKALDLVVFYEFCEIALTSKQKRQMCANVSQESVHLLSILKSSNKKNFLLQMLLLFYDTIEDEKYYYSDPIYRKFD